MPKTTKTPNKIVSKRLTHFKKTKKTQNRNSAQTNHGNFGARKANDNSKTFLARIQKNERF